MSLFNQFSSIEARDVHKYATCSCLVAFSADLESAVQRLCFPSYAMYSKMVLGGTHSSDSATTREKILMHDCECSADVRARMDMSHLSGIQLSTIIFPQCKSSHCSAIRHYSTRGARKYLCAESCRRRTEQK